MNVVGKDKSCFQLFSDQINDLYEFEEKLSE